MSYCINPRCSHRENPDGLSHCKSCQTPLLIEDRYRLIRPLRELDEWEPSEVFEIDDRGQTKVLKVLKKKILQPLFEREAATLQTLNHPGIPQVDADGYFSLEIDGRPLYCLVMENIQGINLNDWLQQHGPTNQATAIGWMKQLVDLLAQLHQEELFHRDIKLANIKLRPTVPGGFWHRPPHDQLLFCLSRWSARHYQRCVSGVHTPRTDQRTGGAPVRFLCPGALVCLSANRHPSHRPTRR